MTSKEWLEELDVLIDTATGHFSNIINHTDLIKTIDGLTYDQGEELFALFIIRIQRMTAKLNNMGVLPKN